MRPISITEEMRAALETFLVESGDLLTEMEDGLLQMEADPGDDDAVNAVFRAVHTLKGSSGLFGLDDVVRFSHSVETVLDRVRARQVPVEPALVAALLPCKDHIASLIERARSGEDIPADDAEMGGSELLDALDACVSTSPPAVPSPALPADPVEAGWSPAGRSQMHVSVRVGPDSLRFGMDPLSFVRYLSNLGEVLAVCTIANLPDDIDQVDPETCYLGFEISLDTDCGADEVEAVFEFVREDGDIRVLTASSSPRAYLSLIESYGERGPLVASFLSRTGAFDESAARPEPADPSAGTESPGATEPAAGGDRRSSAPARRTLDRRAGDTSTIRIDAGRLDRLIDSVGEMVIAGAAAVLRGNEIHDQALQTAMGEMMRLVEEVRDGALRLRMVPIGTTFNRFNRVVHDIGNSLGKDVSLVITGGATEVDKALVEQIGDPLTHLVRNSLDHGIESESVRVAAGKPARGTVRLHAFHDSGSIVVEVSDDGAGIDAESVRRTAVERGLLDRGSEVSAQEAYALIFEPGFSTAKAVSDLSGRGVGLDVVKRNVAALRGTIDIESCKGVGTTFRITLPLTLAIIDGFLVSVGDASFVIPLDRVMECVELPPDSQARDYMDLRGEVLPLIRVCSLLEGPGERPRRQSVVVVDHAGLKAGLIVDVLKGEFQAVIKPLGSLFSHVQGVSGSTILGTGDVALILDVPALLRQAAEGVKAGIQPAPSKAPALSWSSVRCEEPEAVSSR